MCINAVTEVCLCVNTAEHDKTNLGEQVVNQNFWPSWLVIKSKTVWLCSVQVLLLKGIEE